MATWRVVRSYSITRGLISHHLNAHRFKAKRKFARKGDRPGLLHRHAGQIFCEMLGQTCYKDFYNNPNMPYQEVSPSPPLLPFCFSLSFLFVTYCADFGLGIRHSWTSLRNNNLLCQTPQLLSSKYCQTRSSLL